MGDNGRRSNRPETLHRDKRGKIQITYGPRVERYIDNEKYPLDWAKCGTEANFKAHIRRGQKPCVECEKANSIANVDRKAKARRRAQTI